MIIGTFIFSLLCILCAFILISRYEKFEKAQAATYVVLIAWGAFIFGVALSHHAWIGGVIE
jgi:hypothetical protein